MKTKIYIALTALLAALYLIRVLLMRWRQIKEVSLWYCLYRPK